METSRVIPRILNVLERVESARRCLITEPPWFPVAPKTVMILDIVVMIDVSLRLFEIAEAFE